MPTAGGRHRTTQPDAQVTARPRVLISEPRGLDSPPIAELLDPAAYDVVWCNGEQDVLEQLVQRRPSALGSRSAPGIRARSRCSTCCAESRRPCR